MPFCYCKKLRGRIRLFGEFREALSYVEGEIRYSRTSLPESLLLAGRQRNSCTADVFKKVGESALIDPGIDLRCMLEQEAKRHFGGILSEGECRKSFEFAAPEGFMDYRMQCASLEKTTDWMLTQEMRMNKDYHDKCRMAWSFGIMGGTILVLMLI